MKRFILLLVLIWLSSSFNNTSFANVPEWLWAKCAGGTDEESGNSVTGQEIY